MAKDALEHEMHQEMGNALRRRDPNAPQLQEHVRAAWLRTEAQKPIADPKIQLDGYVFDEKEHTIRRS